MPKEITSKIDSVSRRTFMQALSRYMGMGAAGVILSQAGLDTALAFDRAAELSLKNGKIFNLDEMITLKHIADTILPATDSPSASQLNCHGFVDNQLHHCHPQDEQQAAHAIVNTIAKASRDHFKSDFSQLTEQQKRDLLVALENEDRFSWQDSARFRLLKYLITFGYFTSEVGAAQVLSYQAVPGGFKGSVPLTEKTTAWGSLEFY